MTSITRTNEVGDRIGEILSGIMPYTLHTEDESRNVGRLVASSLFHPESPMLTGDDLEPLRPCEWLVTWRHRDPNTNTFQPCERSFDNEPAAVAAADALLRVEATLDDVRAVLVQRRRKALAASEWEEVGL